MNSMFDVIKTGKVTRLQMQRAMDKESSCFSDTMQKIEVNKKFHKKTFISAWRSREFFAQVFEEGDVIRISVNRSKIAKSGECWQDGIKWNDLQKIKNDLGYSDRCAVELYPPQKNVVNVANMRHIFVLKELPKFMWGKEEDSGQD